MSLSLPEIVSLFARHGNRQYSGESVTQLEHALQSALQAEQAGSSATLITASLLHDLGHLIYEEEGTLTLQGKDDLHQYSVVPFLRGLFPDAVIEPIKLHVDAKRYLCQIDPQYWSTLSPDSRRSLELQGGVFDAAAAALFATRPHADDAVSLRRFDDLAKVEKLKTPPLDYYLDIARRCVLA